MSNRHLCKGKRTDNGEWVEGYYNLKTMQPEACSRIMTIDSISYEVDPPTICQCPGYKGIWEHDIFQCDEDRYQIKFDEESLTWQAESIFSSESIGLGEFHPNVFDNPELFEVGE